MCFIEFIFFDFTCEKKNYSQRKLAVDVATFAFRIGPLRLRLVVAVIDKPEMRNDVPPDVKSRKTAVVGPC